MTAAAKTQLVVVEEDREGYWPGGCFPAGQLDAHGQQVDLRPINSWTTRPHQVTTVELGETHIINSIAPFLLLQNLLPLLKFAAQNPIRDGKAVEVGEVGQDGQKPGYAHVVMVSAAEGTFNKLRKDTNHVHTNMAKASMNMITRSLGEWYAKTERVLINSVDTGWIDDMTPTIVLPNGDKRRRFIPPLADADGAARVLDPIFAFVNHGIAHAGTLFKDYHPAPW